MAKYFGYNPPFLGGQQNVLSRQSGDRIIKNDLLQLILTMPGERVMRPGWGTIVKRSLFENITPDLISNLTSNISSAIRRYEPRVKVKVDVTNMPDESKLRIKLTGYFTDEPGRTIDLETDLPFRTASED